MNLITRVPYRAFKAARFNATMGSAPETYHVDYKGGIIRMYLYGKDPRGFGHKSREVKVRICRFGKEYSEPMYGDTIRIEVLNAEVLMEDNLQYEGILFDEEKKEVIVMDKFDMFSWMSPAELEAAANKINTLLTKKGLVAKVAPAPAVKVEAKVEAKLDRKVEAKVEKPAPVKVVPSLKEAVLSNDDVSNDDDEGDPFDGDNCVKHEDMSNFKLDSNEEMEKEIEKEIAAYYEVDETPEVPEPHKAPDASETSETSEGIDPYDMFGLCKDPEEMEKEIEVLKERLRLRDELMKLTDDDDELVLLKRRNAKDRHDYWDLSEQYSCLIKRK